MTVRNRFKPVPAALRTIDGIIFDSKREAARYGILKMRLRIGEIDGLELQPTFEVTIGGKHFCAYTPDFSYWDKTKGRRVYEDVKSSGTAKDAAYRLRKKAAMLQHNIIIDEVIAR